MSAFSAPSRLLLLLMLLLPGGQGRGCRSQRHGGGLRPRSDPTVASTSTSAASFAAALLAPGGARGRGGHVATIDVTLLPAPHTSAPQGVLVRDNASVVGLPRAVQFCVPLAIALLAPILLLGALAELVALLGADEAALELAVPALVVELAAGPAAGEGLVGHHVLGLLLGVVSLLGALAEPLPPLRDQGLRMTDEVLRQPRDVLRIRHVLLIGFRSTVQDVGADLGVHGQ
mmetsp:Transcript_119033/g.381444  ORF Transcript_119033/g.381444 Transcript_119033/m.381444 type:complete len:231 (+) Transcript_119033:486-1178(+)